MKIKRIFNIFNWLRDLSVNSNKNLLFLLADFIQLKRSGCLSRSEYQNYRMYEQTKEFRNNFLSYSEACKYWKLLNPVNNACLARNKYLSYCLLNAAQIPTANLCIYYNPEMVLSNDCFAYDYNTVKNILERKKMQTFVVKPASDSAHGEGVFVCKKFVLAHDDCWLIKQSGEKISLRKLLSNIPLLFEELIIQNSQLKSFNPSSVNTVRIMTALYPKGKVSTVAAFLKIGRTGSDVDNAGSGGNVDCGIGIEDGILYNAFEFNSWDDVKRITSHPDTGELLQGVKIAGWEALIRQIENYQLRIPFLKTIGWDVAITDKGPVIIEINNWWDTTGQLFIQRGWKQQILDCYKAWTSYYKQHGK